MSLSDTQTLLRNLWFLYSDVNTRINILIEESAHLQNTVFGLLPSGHRLTKHFATPDPNAESGLSPEVLKRLKDAGFERPVVLGFVHFEKYAGSRPRERALLSLWNTLGAAIVGLVENQATLSRRYTAAVACLRPEAAARKESKASLFWFLATRGYYIDTSFATYTGILEHAHEKIIQMQENRAGSLPAPILLRRWNSGLQGDFLARYARHVNWESSILVARLRSKGKSDQAQRVSITHTWAHHSTSMANPFSLSEAAHYVTEDTHHKGQKLRFGMIRSAYFYLEQPVLFPLLYHETAHLHFPSDAEAEADAKAYKSDFFLNRRDAYETLSKPGIGGSDTDYDNFWDHYTEEIWADALSIALSGRAYLSALTLQLFAATGRTYFSHEDLHSDQVFPLDTLADDNKKIFEAAFPAETESYFWAARLRVASRLCAELNPDDITQAFCRSVGDLLDEWDAAGRDVFTAAHTSLEHEKLWAYRAELNRWVFDTIWRYLAPSLSDLRYNRHVSTMSEVSGVCRNAVDSRVSAYLAHEFQTTVTPRPFDTERLENIALNTRLRVSDEIAKKQLLRWTDEDSRRLTDTFANWKRHDGSTAFRLALEWYVARISMVESDVAALSPDDDNHKPNPCAFGLKRRQLITADAPKKEVFIKALKSKSIFNLAPGGIPATTNRMLRAYDRELQTQADNLICAICDISPDDAREGRFHNTSLVKVGTLSLGALRAAEIVTENPSQDGKAPYLGAINRVHDYFKRTAKAVKDRHDAIRGPNSFHHLIGDYHFATYTEGSTPTERDHYPERLPSILTKPRVVLQVLGDGIKPDKPEQIGRITLIRFPYRAEWHALLLDLQEEQKNGRLSNPSLFLSSAWEDVVLITWHNNEEDLWRVHDRLHISVLHRHVDTQSNVIIPQSFGYSVCPISTPPATNGNGSEQLHLPGFAPESAEDPTLMQKVITEMDASKVKYLDVRHRLGRSDLSITWGACPEQENNQSVTINCAAGLSSLSNEIWKSVGGFSTAFEKIEPGSSPTNGRRTEHRQDNTCRAITVFSMQEC